ASGRAAPRRATCLVLCWPCRLPDAGFPQSPSLPVRVRSSRRRQTERQRYMSSAESASWKGPGAGPRGRQGTVTSDTSASDTADTSFTTSTGSGSCCVTRSSSSTTDEASPPPRWSQAAHLPRRMSEVRAAAEPEWSPLLARTLPQAETLQPRLLPDKPRRR
ncbi:ATPase ARSA1, partial [Frankliniella fusca]